MKLAALTRRGNIGWLFCLLLFGLAQGAGAVGTERFLERLSSETRDGRLVVSVHFIQRVQYISHSPTDYGERLEIRLRGVGPAQMVGAVLGEGLKQLTPSQLPQIREVRASGDLDTDPGVSIWFDRPRRFELRAGNNDRTIEIVLEQDSGPEAAAAAELLSEAPAVPPGTTLQERELAELFRQARLAYNAGRYQRVNAIYDKIIASGIEPYVREATVALGVTRAERGQDAQARAQFERYLEDYPEGPEARRVQRLLDDLLAGEETRDEEGRPQGEPEQPWQVFGSFDQFYLLNHGKLDDQGSETFRSSLLSTANVNWQGRTGDVDVSGRFLGSYDYSFLSDQDSQSWFSYMYLDLAGVDGRNQARLGRQRLSASGVLGYFDGLHYQFRIDDRRAVRYVVGSPVRSTRDGFVEQDHLFNGLAVDFNGVDDRWFLSLYGIYQSFDGETDRRALGLEGRYSGDQVTAYSLLDYDTYFDQLNLFYLFGNWRIRDGTVASLTLDHRRSPGLAVSNAVYGLGADDFDDLQDRFSHEELVNLAEDRSLIYRSAYASLTQQLDNSWQLQLDGGLSSLHDDSEIPGNDSLDSDDWYLSGQLVGNDLLKTGDMFSAGLRYTDAERMDITGVLLRGRVPVNERLRLTPQLRLEYRDRDDGGTQRRILPSMYSTYRLTKRASLELDIGLEFSHFNDAGGGDQDDRFLYLSAGYRYDF
ncbi:MAG: tetratricopeptide repeat protein [Sedimenticolaceae bacterium]